jgi:predicted ArsR family transcriptional regulator
MKTVLDPHDRQFLEHLHRLGSVSVQEMCGDLGVTATAVRQRLGRLQALGFIERETSRAGRGRPHHVYFVTEAGRRQLGENYAELALILWQEIRNIEEPDVRRRITGRIRDALVSRYGRETEGEPLSRRMGRLGEVLAQHGFDVETDASGPLPILRENNCPYLELASADPAICELEQSVFEQVLGTRIVLTHCCLDGHHCCEFQAVES